MNTETCTIFIEGLMSRGYEGYNGDISLLKYIDENRKIPFIEKENVKLAVVLGNFNYQVENGGIGQYLFNGYYNTDIGDTADYFQKILNQYPNEKILEPIKIFYDYIKSFHGLYEQKCECCEGLGYIVENEIKVTECDDCDGKGFTEINDITKADFNQSILNNIDEKYYQISNDEKIQFFYKVINELGPILTENNINQKLQEQKEQDNTLNR